MVVKWKDLVDTFRSTEKSGAEGASVAEKAQNWGFYNRMSFMKPYIYKGGKSHEIPCRSSFNALSLSVTTVL